MSRAIYSLLVQASFKASHFLIGKDFGVENNKHSHHYSLEVEIEGDKLDQHNYLIDIVDVKKNIDQIVELYKDKTLNNLSEFSHQNPSLELFSKILWSKITTSLNLSDGFIVTVKLWEDDIARASYSTNSNDRLPNVICSAID